MHSKPIPQFSPTVLAQFDEQVSIDEDCWTWLGRLTPGGYGKFRVSGEIFAAHRVSYVQSRGSIPDGLVLDHLCRYRACVNPDHLEAVSQLENVRRGAGNASKVACQNGHPFEDGNLAPSTAGRRVCRTCHRNYHREYQQKLRAARVAERV